MSESLLTSKYSSETLHRPLWKLTSEITSDPPLSTIQTFRLLGTEENGALDDFVKDKKEE